MISKTNGRKEFLFIASREKKSELNHVIKNRRHPGILVFDIHGKLLYLNEEAVRLFNIKIALSLPFKTLPGPIKSFHTQLKRHLQKKIHSFNRPLIKISLLNGHNLILRGFFLPKNKSVKSIQKAQILILAEQFSQRKTIDFPKIGSHLGLTLREAEVATHIAHGHKNKEIAAKMFISIYTVEDHLKNIMRKMKVSSRTAVAAKLLNPLFRA